MKLFVRLAKASLLTVVFLQVGVADASAQKRQTRNGFWIGLGSGFGSVNSACASCGVSDLAGTDETGYIRLGGTLNRHLLIGAEFGDWQSSEGGLKETRDVDLIAAYYYPFSRSGLFLKGGLGSSRFESGDGITGRGWAVASGLGYDLRVFRNISITTEASYWFGSVGRLKNSQDLTVARDYTQNVFDVRVGLTVH